jgi:hypothetical protein
MERVNSWTAEEEAWLRSAYADSFNSDLAEMHAELFPDRPRRSAKAINSRAKVYGLHKREGFDRAEKAKEACRVTWPPERVEWLRAYAPGHNIYEIMDEFERLYGFRLTKCSMKNAKQRYGAYSGTNVGQFQKGMVPHNKGKTWDEQGIAGQARENMRKNHFKKGNIPQNAQDKPIGYERVDREGYTLVKVAERPSSPDVNDNFVLKQRLIWEAANGPVPPDHHIAFADRDKSNFDLDNLVCVPKALWSVIQRSGWAYHDRASLEACITMARLRRETYKLKCHPRRCKKCGTVFQPRHPNHRTCDACLAARRES